MSHTAFNPPLVSREMAPYAWVVVKDDFALRLVGETKKDFIKIFQMASRLNMNCTISKMIRVNRIT
jgi:hypothetical protein